MSAGRALSVRSVVATSVVVALACLFWSTAVVYADAIVGPEPTPSPTPSPSPHTSQTAAATTTPSSGSGGNGNLAVLAGAGVAVVAVAAGAGFGLRRLTAGRAKPAGLEDDRGRDAGPDGEAGA
jgi:hypothetical protein